MHFYVYVYMDLIHVRYVLLVAHSQHALLVLHVHSNVRI